MKCKIWLKIENEEDEEQKNVSQDLSKRLLNDILVLILSKWVIFVKLERSQLKCELIVVIAMLPSEMLNFYI